VNSFQVDTGLHLEDAVQVALFDAATVVLRMDSDIALPFFGLYPDQTSVGVGIDGIVQEVHDRLIEYSIK
jgi:hypothetical protein